MSHEPPYERLICPTDCAGLVTLNGRSYAPQKGVAILVHPDDIAALGAEGWSRAPLVVVPQDGQPSTDPVTTAVNHPPLLAGQPIMRLLIPPAAEQLALEVNGRRYGAEAGQTIDAPESEALILATKGWVLLGQAGTSEERPALPRAGDRFLDDSLGLELIFDGADWRNSATGAVV